MKININSDKMNDSIETKAAVVVMLNDEEEAVDSCIIVDEISLKDMMLVAYELKEASDRIVDIATDKMFDHISKKAREL